MTTYINFDDITYEDTRNMLISAITTNEDIVHAIISNTPYRNQLLNPLDRELYLKTDPFITAIESNKPDIIRLFLDSGAKIELDNYLLVLKVISDTKYNIEIFSLFIEYGLDIFLQVDISLAISIIAKIRDHNHYHSIYQILNVHTPRILNKYSHNLSKCIYFLTICSYTGNVDLFMKFFIKSECIKDWKNDILFWSSFREHSVFMEYMLYEYSFDNEFIREMIDVMIAENRSGNLDKLFKAINYMDTDGKIITYFSQHVHAHGIHLCLTYNVYTSAQQSNLMKIYGDTEHFLLYVESYHLNTIKEFVFGGFDLNEIADDLIIHCYSQKYYKIVSYLKEIGIDRLGALARAHDKLAGMIADA